MEKGELPTCAACGDEIAELASKLTVRGVPGHFHAGCAVQTRMIRNLYRAGHIAGLREAAEWHEAEAEKVQPAWPALASIEVPDADALAIRRDISGHNRWSAMVFRARITALEEEGKS